MKGNSGKDSVSRRPAPFAVGDVFNPRKMFVGIFIPEALVATTDISSTAKLAWGHLARRAGKNGRCFPSKRDIGKHVGIKERQINRMLNELVEGRFIRKVSRTGASGRSTSNEYEFLWHPLLEPSLRKEGVADDIVASVVDDTETVTAKSPTGVSRVTPLEERTKNHQQHKTEIGKEKSAERSTVEGSSRKDFDIKIPDDELPKVEYATPGDEIKAVAKAKLGHDLPLEDFRWILETLELQGVSGEEYIAEVRKHSGNLWKNPIGMLKSLAKGFRRKLKPAGPPITKAQFEDLNYRCLQCTSTIRGEGAHLVAGGFVPCECASEEFIEKLKAKGLLASSKGASQVSPISAARIASVPEYKQ